MTFLHNEGFFAVAQRSNTYIYDQRGMEVHRLDAHVEPRCLQFLPHHFLLASLGHRGALVGRVDAVGRYVHCGGGCARSVEI